MVYGIVLIYMFHILQSITDISDNHTFFSALQIAYQVKKESVDQFRRYILC